MHPAEGLLRSRDAAAPNGNNISVGVGGFPAAFLLLALVALVTTFLLLTKWLMRDTTEGSVAALFPAAGSPSRPPHRGDVLPGAFTVVQANTSVSHHLGAWWLGITGTNNGAESCRALRWFGHEVDMAVL